MQAEPPSSDSGHPSGTDAVRWRVNLPFLLLVVLGLPFLVSLGFWQLARAAEKEQALLVIEAQRIAPPVPVGSVDLTESSRLDGRRVVLRGRYLPETPFLLDNRILAGRVGYELLMPFADVSGHVVLVNRGWLLAPPTRDQFPQIDTPAGELELRGEIHVPLSAAPGDPMASTGWPSVIQSVEVPALAVRAGMQTFPYLVRLEPGQPGVTEADWPRVNMSPDRHRAYAAQWFLMTIALAVVFVTGGTNTRAWLRARRQQKAAKQ